MSIKLRSDCKRAFAAENHQRVNAKPFQIPNRFLENVVAFINRAVRAMLHEASAIASAEDCAASRKKPAHVSRRQLARLCRRKKPFKAILYADDAHAILAYGCLHHCANHGVQARRVAPSCQNSYGLVHTRNYFFTRGGSK